MSIKIESRKHLEGIIYTWFKENEDCIIELQDLSLGGHIYFMSSKLPDGTIFLSVCAGNDSIGNVIFNNNKSRIEWIKDVCDIIDFDKARIVADLKSPNKKKDIPSYKDNYSYLKTYQKTKSTVPIKIIDIDDAEELFWKFLNNDKCDKMIYSFNIPIPDLDNIFKLDCILDKVFVYGRTLISYATTTDGLNCFASDFIIEHDIDRNKENEMHLWDICKEILLALFSRCALVSSEEIDIYVYSNCELI